MKTSVSLALQLDSGFSPFTAADFDKGLDWAKNLGVDGVELIILNPNTVDAGALMEKLTIRGLAVATLATGQMAGEGLTFCDESASVRDAAVKRICDHIDLSIKLGNPNVTIGLARGKGSDDLVILQKQFKYVKDCVKRCGEYASEKGIRINLEPLNRYETHMLHSSVDTLEMIEDIGCASVGILYDTFHSNIEDADMCGIIAHYAKHFSHVHFADSNRHVPGEGHTDFPAIVRALKKAGYSGFVSLEVLNLPNAEQVIANAAAFKNYVNA